MESKLRLDVISYEINFSDGNTKVPHYFYRMGKCFTSEKTLLIYEALGAYNEELLCQITPMTTPLESVISICNSLGIKIFIDDEEYKYYESI